MPNNAAHDTRTTVPANRLAQAVGLNVAARVAAAASFTPLVVDNYAAMPLGSESTFDRVSGSVITNEQSVSGGKSAKLLTKPAELFPACGGNVFFGGKRYLSSAEKVTVGYTIWQRLYVYFPTEFSFGYQFSVRDDSTLSQSAAAGATNVFIPYPGTVSITEGQSLTIYLNDGSMHYTKVATGGVLGSAEYVMEDPLPSDADAGNEVATYDKADRVICYDAGNSNIDGGGGNTGIKWLVFGPDSPGGVRVYMKIGNSRREIDQPANAILNIENEAGGNSGGNFQIPRNEWVEFQLAVKVALDNTGWIRAWVNGNLISEKLNTSTIPASNGATAISEYGLGDYWNGGPYTDGQPGRDTFYVDEYIVATDMPGYGAPTGVDAAGNAYIDPATRVGELV